MGETLWELMFKLADILHWFGKNTESDAVTLTARFVRSQKCSDIEEWEAFVVKAENVACAERGDAE